MSQYLLINRIKVQGANAVSGFTWGFPAITHFLGFTHNLTLKLEKHADLSDIRLSGCAVIAHQHQVHTYGYNQFIQSKNPAYQYGEDSKNKVGSPPIIEEGKMNMTVSLLIGCDGNIGNREEAMKKWLFFSCNRQRLAGGTVMEIGGIELFTIDDGQNNNLRMLTRKLLPGFVLQDRSVYLEKHVKHLQEKNEQAELFDAWLDFIALKQKARPISERINRHLVQQAELSSINEAPRKLLKTWLDHLEKPYDQNLVPDELKSYFGLMSENNANRQLLAQWKEYCEPNEKTDADWQSIPKPEQGFLVPIMVGYKAISQVYNNDEVANTRDHETDVCFVEAVHSIGEWQGVHRIRDEEALKQSLWQYDYQKHWYLCKQTSAESSPNGAEIYHESPDDFS
ncbi:MAG: type I-F CRISPR-associated protein Csy2 [Bacteroidales bacterium]